MSGVVGEQLSTRRLTRQTAESAVVDAGRSTAATIKETLLIGNARVVHATSNTLAATMAALAPARPQCVSRYRWITSARRVWRAELGFGDLLDGHESDRRAQIDVA